MSRKFKFLLKARLGYTCVAGLPSPLELIAEPSTAEPDLNKLVGAIRHFVLATYGYEYA